MVLSEEQQEKVEMSAEVLYGLIHARYVLTSAGLAAVNEKYQVSLPLPSPFTLSPTPLPPPPACLYEHTTQLVCPALSSCFALHRLTASIR